MVLRRRELLDKVVIRKRHILSDHTELAIVKDYWLSEKSLGGVAKEYGVSYSTVRNCVNDGKLTKNAITLPEIFNKDDLTDLGMYEAKIEIFLDKMLNSGSVYRINVLYTTSKDLADYYKVTKERRPKKPMGIIPTRIREIPLDAEVRLVKTVSRERGYYPTIIQKGKVSEQIKERQIKILNAVNIKPENAFLYEEELTERQTIPNYIATYEKELFPLSFNLMKAALRVNDGERVLDLGCGVNAPVLAAISKSGRKIDYVGVDVVEEIQEGNRIRYGDGKFLTLRVPYELNQVDGKFDLIAASLFFDAINTPETYATLLYTHQLLKNNGEMLITLSDARVEEARRILVVLKGMGYDTDLNPSTHKFSLVLKHNEETHTNRFYIVRAKKTTDTNLEQLYNYYLAVSYLRAGKPKEADRILKEKQIFANSLGELVREDIRISGNKHERPTFMVFDGRLMEKYDVALKQYEEIGRKLGEIEAQISGVGSEIDRCLKLRDIMQNAMQRIPDDVSSLLKSVFRLDPEEILDIAKTFDNFQLSYIWEKLGISDSELLNTVKGRSNSKRRNRFSRYLGEFLNYVNESSMGI